LIADFNYVYPFMKPTNWKSFLFTLFKYLLNTK
jgi:hypothetical protein